jgi:hypothetical protein
MTHYTVHNVKVEGTQLSPELFTTGVGKLAYNYGITAIPPISILTHSVSVVCNATPRCDAKINRVGDITTNGGNIDFYLAVSDTGKSSSDGFFYCDITILLHPIPNVIDSYSEINRDGFTVVYTSKPEVGQSFTGNGLSLSSCKFYLKTDGSIASPPGSCRAKLYSHSGVYGISSLPNVLLATSTDVSCAEITSIWTLISFQFPLLYPLPVGYYVIVFEYLDGGGGVGQSVLIGYDNSSVPANIGNRSEKYVGVWGYNSNQALCFYTYGMLPS